MVELLLQHADKIQSLIGQKIKQQSIQFEIYMFKNWCEEMISYDKANEEQSHYV